jgi:hypothetical protein
VKGLSRRALRHVDADEALPAAAIPDAREADIKALTLVDERVFETLREVFDGTGLMGDQRKVKLLLKLRTDVVVAWGQTRDAFIEIGRALNDVDRELAPEERDRFKQGFRKLFPFSDTVASQFRAIARAVDDGRLPRELVPGSYGAAYQMALLTPGQREIAGARGLIRPDVSRDALIGFRREVQAVRPGGGQGLEPARMRADLARLERAERKAADALETVRARIRELRALLGQDKTDA